ncbi:ABC transporter substrate-binding protein [Kribbella qitaiheensis]|uniref:ABC transporter substrate-binding protein n=1 Tax=Kribbella qitaiheensis TaxID=1544730 RepID=A0A7G6WW83_9ACTN|nr:ABC transporter substrate-binding protein [Kribbella qitaiheensis]QNE18248.1 ABC transporter substrate-binding protein [Kribbella qitaiheensis]
MTRPAIARPTRPTHRPAPRAGRRTRLAAVLGAGLLAVTACGSTKATSAAGAVDASDWSSVLAQAKGQTVNWYMYGGDDVLNTFVTGYVADQLEQVGVGLKQIKITDTVDAVNAVIGARQAGQNSGGSVDAIWINGENFATGVQSKLWNCGWPGDLPNSKYVDFTNPGVANDFGVPVNGCEAAWQQANSALVYDSSKLSTADIASVSSLIAWATAHPGHFTYPALPDFTGSMAVRTILYDTIGGPASLSGPFEQAKYAPAATKLWTRLNALAPSLWRGGATYPQSQAAVEKLYSDGEISAFLTYGPGAVGAQVSKGLFPASTRETVPAPGNIANVSFLAIPYNAAHTAGALVLANVLQDPQTQLALYKAEGIYPGIDLAKTDAATQAQFAAVPISRSVLPLAALTRHAQPELASGYVSRLEHDWKTQVLQRSR